MKRNSFAPYGEVYAPTVIDGTGYTGHVMDQATGLTYMQQRYYDPQIGRFLSNDPVSASAKTGGNFNRYNYANNNPYRFADPDGRQAQGRGSNMGPQNFGIGNDFSGSADYYSAGSPESRSNPAGGKKEVPISRQEQALLNKGTKESIIKFYEGRSARGDGYAKLALGVVKNEGALGKLANAQLAMEVMSAVMDGKMTLPASGYSRFMEGVSVDLARAHGAAVRADMKNDVTGTPGLLSPGQIQAYHEAYFQSIGLPASTFGGQTAGWNNQPLMHWCNGCDAH